MVFVGWLCIFFFQAEDGIRDLVRSRGLGDVYKRQALEMYDLRDDAERVMRINFPDSYFLAELPEVGAKAWWEFWK